MKKTPLTMPNLGDYGTWDMDRLATVAPGLEDGDFTLVGQLIHWLCADGRVAHCCVDRAAAFRQDARIAVSGGTEAQQELLKRDIAMCIPSSTVATLLTWYRMLNAEFCQILWDAKRGPVIQPWNVQFLRQDSLSGEWQVRTKAAPSKILDLYGKPYDGYQTIQLGEDWLLMGTEIDPHPWHGLGVGWNVLGPLRIGGVNALVWWMLNAMHTSISPLKVRTEGITDSPAKEKFFAALKELGQTLYIEVPFGADMERVKSEPQDFESPKQLKQEVDKCITEFLKGQSTTTRLEGGSYNSVEVLINEVSATMLGFELDAIAYSLNWHWMPLWRRFRGIDDESISFAWELVSLKNRERKANVLATLAKAGKDWPELATMLRRLAEEL